jgi:glycosyltransferase involved in cell wall biosynthesis
MEQLPAITVIVPARNAEATIGACVRSVVGGAYPPERRRVLVVDNASSDATPAIVRQLGVQVATEQAIGPSHARNRGIAESSTELIAFLDADCVASTGWLRELVAAFDSPEVGAVAGEILSYPPRTAGERYMALRHPLWQKHALETARPYAVTANLAVRRGTFDRIGLFDPLLPRGQDMDFGWRFFRDGTLRMGYRSKALVFHRHRATPGAFFRQQMGWGRGHALLHAKYGLPWSLGRELRQYREVCSAAGSLAMAIARHAVRGGDRMQVYYPLFELLRRVAARAGALHGWLDLRSHGRWTVWHGGPAS